MFNEFLCIDKSISKNKAFNLSLILETDQLKVGFGIFRESKKDHAKIGFYIHLILIEIKIYIYDKRPWNYEENRWNRDDDYYCTVTL